MGQRRGFTSEYRRDVAGQVIGTGCTIASVTRDLGLGEQMVGRWVKAERERREAGAAGVPGPRELAAENVRLRRRVRELEMENEFLGKSQRPRCFQAPAAWRLALMEAEKAGYPIALMARVLGVTRAGFYAWGLVVLVGGRGRQVVGSQVGWWRGSLLVPTRLTVLAGSLSRCVAQGRGWGPGLSVPAASPSALPA